MSTISLPELTASAPRPDGVIDSYPLSPLQQGIVYYSIYGQIPGAYLMQLVGTLHEPIDANRLRRAWQETIERHSILRTSFQMEGSQGARQHVHQTVELLLEEQDWRGTVTADREAGLDQFLLTDRKRGLKLAQPPVFRLNLIRFGEADYRLIWTFPHALLDGRSYLLILKEVFARYDSTFDPNEPAPKPYRDYVDWLGKQDFTPSESFWRQTLKNFRTPTQLISPHAVRNAPAPDAAPAQQEIRLPGSLTSVLSSLAEDEEVTIKDLLHAAWALLLSRYSGEEEVVFGTTRAGRTWTTDRADSMAGIFINTLPFRAAVPGDKPITDWLKDLRGRSAALRPYEQTPLLLVQEWTDVPRGTPLFETIVVYENYQLNPVLKAQGGAWANRDFRLLEKTHFPLVLAAYGGDELQLKILYDRTRFDADTVTRMLGHLKTLLEGMVANPQQPLSALPILTEAERKRMVFDWNNTKGDYPRDKCIHQLAEEQAVRTPDVVAVIADKQSLTYKELNTRANRLANFLRKHGVGPGILVDLFMTRSADMIVGMLGILKAGGAYVPLDPAHPKDRLAFLIKDTQPKVILTQQALVEKLPDHQVPMVCIDTDWMKIAGESGQNLSCKATPTDLAYMIFTSGSTGIPKGVVLRHGPVVNTLDWVNKTFKVGPDDILLFVTSQCFDLSVYDVFGSLAAGSTIRVASPDELRDPEKLVRILCDEDITFWDSAPPTLQQLVPFFPAYKDRAAASKLRLVQLSGDWIPVPMPDQIRNTFTNVQVISLGGATEAAIWSNYYKIGDVDPKWPSIPYGIPIQNSRYHILDKYLNPVPIGVAAELHIGGDCLAEGYHNRAELTAERFIPDPFSENPKDRLYKTGDLARYFPDGNIEFLGRIDHQVKIRGYRIELGEIEAVLAKHAAVRDSVVLARPDPSGNKCLVGYVTPKAGQEIVPADLKVFLKDKLPDYMVPAHILKLADFPLNTNGKIDRKALPAPDFGGSEGKRTVVLARTDAQRELVPIWEEVLKVKPISVTDNFFDLGGHSFLAAVLMSKIKQQLGHSLSVGTVFAAPTVEKLAKVLEKNLEAGAGSCLVPLHEEGKSAPLFLIAGVGGHVFTFHKFARLLGSNQPTFGVKAIGVDGDRPPPDRIETIAGHYLKEITAVRPEGPIMLGGYSIGALVAFELATQLRAAGRQVPMLVVFDMNAPGYPRPLPFHKRMLLHVRNFFHLDIGEKTAYLKQRFKNVGERALQSSGLGIMSAPKIQGAEGLEQNSLRRVWAALMVAKKHYDPKKTFDGKIILFKAEEGFQWAATVFDDPLMGWGHMTTGGVEEFAIPGQHMEMFHDKNINLLAGKLRDCVGKYAKPLC